MKNLAGLWMMQECLRHWERDGQCYAWPELLEAAAHTPPFQTLLDPNDNRFEVQTNMPLAIRNYCRDTSQCVPETAGAFARAVFESLALKYRSVLGSLEKLTLRAFSTIRIVGGGSLNALLCQMVADACNRRVVAGPAEATSLGNVMVQALATGYLASFDEGRGQIRESIHCVEYQPNPSDAWDEAYARFKGLEVN
jgi:rhamnulokinase